MKIILLEKPLRKEEKAVLAQFTQIQSA